MSKHLKRCCAFLTVLFLLICTCACGTKDRKDNYSAGNISKKILELCPEDITYTQLTAQQTVNFYGLSEALLHDFSVYISEQDDRYDTVAVFSYKDKGERAVLAESIATSIKSSETTVKVVNDVEYKKIQNRLIMELEDKLILVITENTSEISDMLTELGAKSFVS